MRALFNTHCLNVSYEPMRPLLVDTIQLQLLLASNSSLGATVKDTFYGYIVKLITGHDGKEPRRMFYGPKHTQLYHTSPLEGVSMFWGAGKHIACTMFYNDGVSTLFYDE